VSGTESKAIKAVWHAWRESIRRLLVAAWGRRSSAEASTRYAAALRARSPPFSSPRVSVIPDASAAVCSVVTDEGWCSDLETDTRVSRDAMISVMSHIRMRPRPSFPTRIATLRAFTKVATFQRPHLISVSAELWRQSKQVRSLEMPGAFSCSPALAFAHCAL
jgi:hypothetical protein